MDIDTVSILLGKVAVFAPITIALVKAVNMTELVPSRLLPLVAVIIGVLFGWFFVAASAVGVFAGLALGLTSVGLFEFGKTTVAGK